MKTLDSEFFSTKNKDVDKNLSLKNSTACKAWPMMDDSK